MAAGEVPVTVVVMTRDRRENVLATLTRLTQLPERPAIIVVDNGSSDGTVPAVHRSFPGVRVISLRQNQGAPARTLGARAATTPYVAFADDDSWWAPGALRRAAAIFDSCPRLGLLAAQILVGPEQRPDPTCALMADSPLPREPDAPGPSVLGFVACGAVVRREAFLAVGGFSPLIFFFGEEQLLAQDLMAAGWQLAYVPEVVAHHDPGSAVGDRTGRDRLAVRNAVLTLLLRRPVPVAVVQTLRLLAGRRSLAAAAGLLDALRRSPQALRQRVRLPPQVEYQARLLEAARR
ncbi:MAG TPA: glycosyltransferase [Pilimelia sp.]|nr:glycosyltransferase [Pilimelia sp.]